MTMAVIGVVLFSKKRELLQLAVVVDLEVVLVQVRDEPSFPVGDGDVERDGQRAGLELRRHRRDEQQPERGKDDTEANRRLSIRTCLQDTTWLQLRWGSTSSVLPALARPLGPTCSQCEADDLRHAPVAGGRRMQTIGRIEQPIGISRRRDRRARVDEDDVRVVAGAASGSSR